MASRSVVKTSWLAYFSLELSENTDHMDTNEFYAHKKYNKLVQIFLLSCKSQ